MHCWVRILQNASTIVFSDQVLERRKRLHSCNLCRGRIIPQPVAQECQQYVRSAFSTTMIVEYAPGSPISWEEAQKAGSTRSAYSPSAELESSLTSSIRMIVLTIISGS